MDLFHILGIILLFVGLSICTPIFFPQRWHYRAYQNCLEEDSDEVKDNEARMHGAPSRFAKSGFYDRLFRQQNTWGADGTYSFFPSYGFNPNYKKDGPY